MQLCAVDSNGKIVSAFIAAKQSNYFCLECNQIVRVRSGSQRHAHFFHLAPTTSCALHAKSMAHLQTQLYIQTSLPEAECQLEHRFPEISRIADVAWLPQKIIFEIQCSPISIKEVQARNKAYNSIGFQVIWILHDDRYNAPLLTPVEHYLYHQSPFYFTNINAAGKGIIYDQFSLINKTSRKKTLPSLPVILSKPYKNEKISSSKKFRLDFVNKRASKWSIYFSGDLLDLSKNNDSGFQDYLQKAQEIEKEFLPGRTCGKWWMQPKEFCKKFLLRPYRLLFQVILESFCK